MASAPRPPSRKGIQNARAAFEAAKLAIAEQAVDPDLVKHPDLPRRGAKDGEWIKAGEWPGAPWDGMPPNCPVQVLGYNGDVTYCRSATGQLMAIDNWSNGAIEKLFAPYINYAHWAWPAKAKAGKDEDGNQLWTVKRLERDQARNALINEGARRGLFDPMVSVRGRGGWRDSKDRFIWNSGAYLWSSAEKPEKDGKPALIELQAARPAEFDGYFYELKSDVTRPWQQPVNAKNSPAMEILSMLCTWSWERPKVDPLFVLGWIATGFMGGALKWRPVIFTTGGAGVGKSTLQGLIKGVQAASLLDTTDTTQAGIYQRVRNDSLPVMVDELENKPGSERAMMIVELARIAASGGNMNRGGSDHNATMFQARNSFLFSAINPPPLGVQDKSRMAILNLSRLERGQKAMDFKLNDLHGPQLLRQIMDGWPAFVGEILPRWKKSLEEAGLDSRAGDTYGTLLAAAELMLGPEALAIAGVDVSDMAAVGELVKSCVAGDLAEQTDNWQECLELLLTTPIEAWRSGERITVGSTIDMLKDRIIPLEDAKTRLQAAGVNLRKEKDPCAGYTLAVPHKGPALARIFQDTKFRGGVWATALKQGPKDIVLRDLDQKYHKNRIGGSTAHCLLIDIDAFERFVGSDEEEDRPKPPIAPDDDDGRPVPGEGLA